MRRNINKRLVLAFFLGTTLASVVSARSAERSTPNLSHAMLSRLVRVCAPQVNSTTQAAIVAVESGGSPWVLHDDNDDRVYSPRSREEATNFADVLLARNKATYGSRDRGVDVGLAQINSENFMSLGVNASDMLDPCANLHASAQIIAAAYTHERTLLARDAGWRGDEVALQRALQVYNSGRPSGDDAYVRAIYSTLSGTLVREVGAVVKTSQIAVLPSRVLQANALPGRIEVPAKIVSRITHRNGSLFYHEGPADDANLPARTSVLK